MKIYISGPMTGVPRHNAEAFIEADRWVRLGGNEPVNPILLDQELENQHKALGRPLPDRVDYLKRDIQHLLLCQGIFMLRGWSRSRGAKLELHIAQELGMEVWYQR